MIQTVIFDIGYVLVDYDWHDYLMGLFQDETLADIVGDALYGHGVWNELDRGVWSMAQLEAGFAAANPDYARETLLAFHRAGEALSHRPYAKGWVRDLKDRGYQVLYLSNYSQYCIDANPKVLDFLPLMDGGVFSFQEHLIKPDPAIYQCLLSRYGLKAEECVFIDDNAANVKAAKALGIHGVHFTDYEQARGELEKLLS